MATGLRILEATGREQWDAALLTAPRPDVLQSWDWGEFKRAMGGWTPRRVLVLRGDEPVAGAQVLERKVAATSYLHAPRGPWWRDDDGLAALTRWLRRSYALRGPFLRTDPAIEDAAPLLRLGFRIAPRQVQPKATIVVDISAPPEEILNRFDRQVRYNARLAERKGLEVVQGGVELVDEFYALLAETAERKGFVERDVSYFRTLARQFGDAAPIFLARHEGQTIYGAMIVAFGPSAYYLYGASGGNRSVKPSEYVQYRAMLWAKERGAVRYDMWGIPAHPTEDNPLYGVYRFKSGFGGRQEVYAGALDVPLVPLVGWAPARLEVLALKSLSLARGHGFTLVDHLA